MKTWTCIFVLSLTCGSAISQTASWQAYNDSANANGGTTDETVTMINVGRSSPGPASTELLVFGSGDGTGVTATYEETLSEGSVYWTSDAITFDEESDAAKLFGEALDLTGNISYGDAPGWHMDLILEGLDPNSKYAFAGTAMRGGGLGYAERTTNWKIMGAESFVYASSEGAWKVNEESVEFSTGHNEAGYVAKWTDIAPGADGRVVIRTSHSVGEANGGLAGAHAYKGYAGGVFMLELQPLPTASWQAYNDSANANGGTTDETVTMINVGRSSPGPASTELLVFGSGDGTGVTATYEETLSEGSVYWTSDAITFDEESDAAKLFGEALDLTGNISYGDAPGWHMDLILEGLDPNSKYAFAGTAMRGGGLGYAERTTNWKIMGAESFVYASSEGAWKVSEESVEFSTGHNEAGYVAKWTDIAPGADGRVVIRTSHSVGEANGGLAGAHAYKGYAGGVFMLELQPLPTASWQAYNDSANANGGTTDETVTMINVGRSSPGPASTELLVFGSGDGTGVTATYEETLSEGSVYWTSDAITFDEESDAAKLFGEALDLTGNISYGDAPGWHMDLILEGLDPNSKYAFAGTAMRGGGLGYAERTTNWKIMGAESFVYASSEGAWKVSEESVEFSTGHNEAGYVAKWTDIAPGADGRVVIRTSHSVGEANGGLAGAHAYKGYAGGVFMLELQPLPTASWQAYNDSANANGGTTDETVTMINVGRSSPGPASTELLVFGSGDGTGVTATYEETLSEGSVYWTSDAITFDEESDAAKLFGEALDLTGNISYGDAPGWHMDLILEGLDPNSKYAFAGTAMRGGGLGYAERTTNWKIMGAESFVYASSEGAWKVNEESVEFSTGHNEAGYVAKWTDIAPGADGRVVIRTSHSVGEANGGLAGAHAYKGYAGGVFMLELQGGSGAVAPGKGLSILRVFPKENELEAHPNSPLHVVIEHDIHKVDSSSVALFLDGKKVASEIQQVGDRTLVVHESAGAFEDFSDHTVKVEFADDSDAHSQYTKSWNFTVMEWTQYDALPADSAITLTDLGKQERGFAIRVAATDPDEPDPDKEILSDIGDLWWIWDEKHSDHSDRTLFNSKGYYLERAQINYQRDGRTIGNKAGEKLFPGINGTESLIPEGLELPVIHFGLETTALLELDEGYYHMQITTTPIHLLHIGLGDDAVELFPDESVNPGIEDAKAWEYKFVVEKPGLYPFTLFYYDYLGGSSSLTASGGTASSLEWLNIAPTGMKFLINEDDDRAITAYIPPDAIVEVSPATMSVLLQDGNMIVTWSEPGTLQGAKKITGPWNDVVGASSPHPVALGSRVMFYRVRH